MINPRYLLRLSYDGTRFSEMAKGGTGYGVIDMLEKVISYSLTKKENKIRCSPSSRTDSGVHALYNSVMLQTPKQYDISTDKETHIYKWNNMINVINPNSMKILDYTKVAPGFCIRRHVSYRIYTYRLVVAKNMDIWETNKLSPSLVAFTEKDYSWMIPPGFDSSKAQDACDVFKGVHNMASFYKHPLREKNKEYENGSDFQNTIKDMLLVKISGGAPRIFDNDLYDYFNVSIISRSFLREQIRRMMFLIVACGYGRMNTSTIEYLLKNPSPTNFFNMKLRIAPPGGLFLTDVVYDPRMIENPNPMYYNTWDTAEFDDKLNKWFTCKEE
uniref:tRNA pseudouridine synthase n=1 Tax=Parastrongyloides trichosuri TaxID=131310 RepID=A0A0N4Z1Z6_PARTI